MAETTSSAANSTSTAATPIIAQNPPNQIVANNAAPQLPLKLTKFNYPSWRVQFQSLLFGYNLEGYIDGTFLCPPSTIANSDDHTTSPNPAYWLWR